MSYWVCCNFYWTLIYICQSESWWVWGCWALGNHSMHPAKAAFLGAVLYLYLKGRFTIKNYNVWNYTSLSSWWSFTKKQRYILKKLYTSLSCSSSPAGHQWTGPSWSLTSLHSPLKLSRPRVTCFIIRNSFQRSNRWKHVLHLMYIIKTNA